MAGKRRTEISFEVGQWIFVKLQPYRKHSVAIRKNQKLGMRYFGPCQIVKRISNVAHRLALLEEAHIHLVFYVSLLKKGEGDRGIMANQVPLPLITTELGLTLQQTAIIQHRINNS